MKKNEIKKEYENEVLDITRVERMTSGGRRLRFRTLIVIGDKKGKVGVGLAKGHDVQQAIEKAIKNAQKSIVKIPVSENKTIPHEVKAKFKAAVILLKPQTEGKGLVAGGTVRTICHLAGIENISGKILGNTRSKLNNAKATIKALSMLDYSERKSKDKETDKVEEKETVKKIEKTKKENKNTDKL